ncbi:MAG: alpha/beta fold hydrolase [Myxococcota bacterium]
MRVVAVLLDGAPPSAARPPSPAAGLPGHGASDIPAALTSDVLERGLAVALDRAVHPERPVVLFASSLSGGLAIRYAARRPERVAGLMLCSPGGVAPTPEEYEDLSAALSVGSFAEALAFVDRAMTVPSVLRPVYAWGVWRQFQRPHLRRFVAAGDGATFLREEEIAALSMPVHVIWGAQDRLLPARHLEVLRAALGPQATFEMPATFGHAPFLHHGDALVARLVRFLRRCGG